MRYFDKTNKYDLQEAKEMEVPSWMLDCLQMNPSYCSWGPYEDCMTSGVGWNEALFFETFDEMFELDDLNEVVNFYFSVERNAEDCPVCLGTGKNKEVAELQRSWYDFERRGDMWRDKLTHIEVDALVKEKRINPRDFNVEHITPNIVNAAERDRSIHDAINRAICIEARARSQGIWEDCPNCNGNGYLFTEEVPRLSLTLWVIHPRKGASRGVLIRHIPETKVNDAIILLAEASERNSDRFSKIKA